MPARKPKATARCPWAKGELYEQYHDTEWGVPVHDDRQLFESLVLGGAQAGLSWSTILNKRENYRRAFDRFDPAAVARFNRRRIEKLLGDAGLVRNRLKIESAVSNAKAFLKVQEEFGSFAAFLWGLFEEAPRQNCWQALRELPASTPDSDLLSQELKRRGFKFVGSTICYAYMQAVGLVNDHLVDCFRYSQVQQRKRK